MTEVRRGVGGIHKAFAHRENLALISSGAERDRNHYHAHPRGQPRPRAKGGILKYDQRSGSMPKGSSLKEEVGAGFPDFTSSPPQESRKAGGKIRPWND
jgi:hypothetical protein